jgi:excisionase family DNA binding protein
MEPIAILQGITAKDLLAEIEKIIEQKLDQKLAEFHPKNFPEYKTTNQVIKMLKISLPTLHEWTKPGFINSYRIGRRILYKTEDITDALRQNKYHRMPMNLQNRSGGHWKGRMTVGI